MSSKAVFLVLLIAAFAKGFHLNPLDERTIYHPLLDLNKGLEVLKGNYPYIVSLQVKTDENGHFQHFCAGSILDGDWILTAAHCFDKIDTFIVKAGKHDLRIIESTEQTAQVEKLIIHEKYLLFNYDYDIALIKLKTSFNFTSEVQAIELSKVDTEPTNVAYRYGWNFSSIDDSISPDVLQGHKFYLWGHFVCNRIIKTVTKYHLTDEYNICAGPVSHFECNVDFGGPLVTYQRNKPVLIGIASWLIRPCGSGPVVFTRVSKFNTWVENTISLYYKYL